MRVTNLPPSYFLFYIPKERMIVIAEACPPADTGSGRGPTETSGRKTTQKTLGGSEVSEANEVLRNHYHPPGETL